MAGETEDADLPTRMTTWLLAPSTVSIIGPTARNPGSGG
jgi:hypothetical protein